MSCRSTAVNKLQVPSYIGGPELIYDSGKKFGSQFSKFVRFYAVKPIECYIYIFEASCTYIKQPLVSCLSPVLKSIFKNSTL
jgi:hypothetical protein